MLTKLALAGFLGAGIVSRAATPDPDAIRFFEQKIQPIFSENCHKCHSHSADKIKGGLVVDSLDGLLKGGDSGPALVPGHPEQSLFIKAIGYADQDLQMPPKGKKLSPEQIALLENWVRMGAPWPGNEPGKKVKVRGKITAEDRAWWAFQPVRDPIPPAVKDDGWAKNPVDKFVFAKLQSEGLAPAPEANRRTLIRRLYFDLWGLPPSPEEIEAFVSDSSPGAYEQLVNRLLDSPHYGERWARHWLDLVRFAESDGYKADGFRPNAWRYRDYVIKSFNEDKPYNQFIREQLAGDELAPDDPEAIVGTMFLRHGIYEYNNPDARGQWEGILNELTDVTGDVFMGMGMACARCHDHKFDPILQKDYFRLQAFFAPLSLKDDVAVADAKQKAEYNAKLRHWEESTREIRADLAVIENDYRAKNFTNAIKKFPDDIQELLCKPRQELSIYEKQIVDLSYLQVAPAFEELDKKLKGEQKTNYVTLRKKLAEFDSLKPKPLPSTYSISDIGPVAPATLIPKSRIKDPIAPGFLTLLQEAPAQIKPISASPGTTGRRAALASWLTEPTNPLSTRVMVNRLWQHHFGRGIVATTSDFGKLGQPPTHPELLDWLTSRFLQEGWSLKKIHRLIVTSATYRQNAVGSAPELAMKKDPENLFLWRMSTRRLEADQIRDALLMAADELNPEMGGASVDPSKPRRSIYTKVRRNTHDPLLQAFDAPDNISSTPLRNTTTTPTQALLMFNSQPVIQRARGLTARLEKEHLATASDIVTEAYRLSLGREPDPVEKAQLTQFLTDQEERINRELLRPKPFPFLAEGLPAREGKAAIIERDGAQKKFEIPDSPSLPSGDFTVEAIVLIKPATEESSFRTIAGHWNGAKTQSGWSFGITPKKSYDKPQLLALQLASNAAKGGRHEEILSDIKIDTSKTYYVAVTVHLGETNQSGITFYAKNLANDEDALQVSHATHQVTQNLDNDLPLTIGSLATDSLEYEFQGLIDEVRLSRKVLTPEHLMTAAEGVSSDTVGYWQLKSEKDFYKDRSEHGNNITPRVQDSKNINPRRAAIEDMCHVLLNSNEFFYVD